MVGMRYIVPAHHFKGSLGYWGRGGQKKGVNRPLCYPWDGNAENNAVTGDIALQCQQGPDGYVMMCL